MLMAMLLLMVLASPVEAIDAAVRDLHAAVVAHADTLTAKEQKVLADFDVIAEPLVKDHPIEPIFWLDALREAESTLRGQLDDQIKPSDVAKAVDTLHATRT